MLAFVCMCVCQSNMHTHTQRKMQFNIKKNFKKNNKNTYTYRSRHRLRHCCCCYCRLPLNFDHFLHWLQVISKQCISISMYPTQTDCSLSLPHILFWTATLFWPRPPTFHAKNRCHRPETMCRHWNYLWPCSHRRAWNLRLLNSCRPSPRTRAVRHLHSPWPHTQTRAWSWLMSLFAVEFWQNKILQLWKNTKFSCSGCGSKVRAMNALQKNIMSAPALAVCFAARQ